MEWNIPAVPLGKIQLEDLPCFCYHLGYKPMSLSPSPLPADMVPTVLWLYSLGYCWVSDQPRVWLIQHNQLWECTGRLWEPMSSTRGCRTGPEKDRNQRALWTGEVDTLIVAGTLQSACCCMFSSLLLILKGPCPGRDCSIGQDQVL